MSKKVVFVSLPFGDKSIKEIKEEIREHEREIKDCFNGFDVELIDNAISYNVHMSSIVNDKLFYRGKALCNMARADVMYCIGDFMKANGCLTEIYSALLAGMEVWFKYTDIPIQYYKITTINEFNEFIKKYNRENGYGI